ncbi:hypothetical protein C2G38_2192599 [Gigaspora rosea]|uniref:Uncharacterized protein n=1 Tax=Gigaspora rosea TaxID=44941 RepID=A0A397V0C1_9GLOM|nr:hypothetical protein C2G38_2192599 [Gigaspora rosea]
MADEYHSYFKTNFNQQSDHQCHPMTKETYFSIGIGIPIGLCPIKIFVEEIQFKKA